MYFCLVMNLMTVKEVMGTTPIREKDGHTGLLMPWNLCCRWKRTIDVNGKTMTSLFCPLNLSLVFWPIHIHCVLFETTLEEKLLGAVLLRNHSVSMEKKERAVEYLSMSKQQDKEKAQEIEIKNERKKRMLHYAVTLSLIRICIPI